MTQPDTRIERLRGLFEELSAADPSPGDGGDDRAWDAWMEKQAADGDLAGLISQAIHGARFHRAELRPYRTASERFGSILDAELVAEAYQLLADR